MISDKETAEAAVRRFIDRAQTTEDARVGMHLTGILTTHDNLQRQNDHLRSEVSSLKRKMGYLEQRARGRMHALVDVFLVDRRDDGSAES